MLPCEKFVVNYGVMSDQSCSAIDEIHHRSLMNRVKGHVTNEFSVTQKAFKSNRQQPKVGKFE